MKPLLIKPASRLAKLTGGGENSEGLDGGESKDQARQMEITSVNYTELEHHLTISPLNPVRGLPGRQLSEPFTGLPAPTVMEAG